MKISVIIPMKNEEKLIIRAINSVLFQKYKVEFEIIVVDDHSTDNSYNIVHDMKNETIKYCLSEGYGVSAARNTGIRKSTGDYIIFLDADDSITSDAFEILCTNILKMKNTDIIYNGYIRVREDQSVIKHYKYKYAEGVGKEIIPDYLNKISFTHLGALCFRKKFIIENALSFDEELAYAEDFYFVTRALYYAKYVGCSYREVYNWTLRKGSTLYTQNLNKFSALNSVLKTKDFLGREEMLNERISLALRNQYAMLLLHSTKSLLWLGCSVRDIYYAIKSSADFTYVKPMRSLSKKVRKDIILLYYFRVPFLMRIKRKYIPNNFCK